MSDGRRERPVRAPGAPAELRWVGCPTCWGGGAVLEHEDAPGAGFGALLAHACPQCLGVGEVMAWARARPPDAPAAAPTPAVPGLPPPARAPAATPARARRAPLGLVALFAGALAGVAVGLLAPPAVAAAAAALVAMFCLLSVLGPEAPAGWE